MSNKYLGSDNPVNLILFLRPPSDSEGLDFFQGKDSLIVDALTDYFNFENSSYRYFLSDASDDVTDSLSSLKRYLLFSEVKNIYLVGGEISNVFISFESFEDVKYNKFPVQLEELELSKEIVLIPISDDVSNYEAYKQELRDKLPGNEHLSKLCVMEIPEFVQHLSTLEKLYDEGKLKEIGFDTETTSLNPHERKAAITTFSLYDEITGKAVACFFKSPEKWVPIEKIQVLEKIIDFYQYVLNINTWEQKEELVASSKALENEWLSLQYFPFEFAFSKLEDDISLNIRELYTILRQIKASTYSNRYSKIASLSEELQLLYEKEYSLYKTGYTESDFISVYTAMSSLLNKVSIIGQNIKFDVTYLLKFNIGKNLSISQDTYADAIFDFDSPKKKDLGTLTEWYTDISGGWKDEMQEDDRVKKAKIGTRYDRVEYQKHSLYAATDGISAYLVGKGELHNIQDKPVYKRLRPYLLRGLKAFAKAEVMGVSVDTSAYEILKQKYIDQLTESIEDMTNLPIANRVLKSIGIEKINPNVNGAKSHVNNVLFSKEGYKLQSIKQTESGYPSVDKSVIDEMIDSIGEVINAYELRQSNPDGYDPLDHLFDGHGNLVTEQRYEELKEANTFLNHLKDYKEVLRLHTTYIGGIKEYEENIGTSSAYFTEFNIVGATVTGRLSSGFHGQPKVSDIKKLWTSAWATTSKREYAVTQHPGERYLPYPPPYQYQLTLEDGAVVTVDEQEYRRIVSESQENNKRTVPV